MKTMFKSNRVAAVVTVAALAVGAGAASPASAQVSQQSVRSLLSARFHGSERVTFVRVAPSTTERASLERRFGTRLPKSAYTVFVATTGTRVDGYAVFDQERGQHELIDFAVFFDGHGTVTGVDVLAYREPYGDAIRGERFRRQFVGRSGVSGFRSGHDIDVVSGATISTRSMCAGVQRAALLVDQVLSTGREAHASR